MSRAHKYMPILSDGEPVLNIVVRLLQPGTTTAFVGTIFVGETGSTAYTPPWTAANGVIDFYLASQARVRIGVTAPGQSETFFEDVDVFEPADSGLILASGTLTITNTPTSAGDVLTATSTTTAAWAPPGSIVAGGGLTLTSENGTPWLLGVGDDGHASTSTS